MSENEATKNWFARQVEGEAKKDRLPFSERAGNGVAVFAILLIKHVADVVITSAYFLWDRLEFDPNPQVVNMRIESL